MIPGKYFRYACLITALANGGGNLGLMLFYGPLFELLGVPMPKDIHYFFWMAGLSFSNGVLAFYVFLNPVQNRDLLKVGVVGKGTFAVMTFYFYFYHGIHWFFLLFGIWDGVFVVIFWLYLIQLQVPDLARMNNRELLPGKGPSTRKAAILLYSLTGTGKSALDQVQSGLESRGYKVDTIHIKPIEKDLFHFPFDSAIQFVKIAVRAILRIPAKIEPLNLPPDHDYDLIIAETQTWFVGMSAPVEAVFQVDSNRKIFEGRDAAVVVVCRGLWRRSQAMLVRHLQRYGANVVASRAYTNAGWEPSRLFTLVAHLVYGEAGRPTWLRWFLQPRCGLSDDDLKDLKKFGQALAER